MYGVVEASALFYFVRPHVKERLEHLLSTEPVSCPAHP